MEEEISDDELLRQYKFDNNPDSLNILFTRYFEIGFRTAMRYMRNQSDAEDVLQLAFIQFLKNIHNFQEGATTIKPWLMKMIINTSLNELKNKKRRFETQKEASSQRLSEYSSLDLEKKNDDEVLKIKIKNVVDTLPEKYRSPIWLVLYEGISYPEVAAVLDLPEKTVRTQVARGLERLRVVLGTMGTVLSIDAISIAIVNSPIEAIHVTATQFLESPQMVQAIHSKKWLMVKNSNQLFNLTSNFIWVKILAVITFVSLSGFLVFIMNKPKEENLLTKPILQEAPVLLKTREILAEDTNRTWSFDKEEDRNLKLLKGNWSWSKKYGAMLAPENTQLLITLPIKSQLKPFLIETVLVPFSEKNKSNLSFHFTCSWVNGKNIIERDLFTLNTSALLQTNKPSIQKTYYYKNYICVFINEECIRVYRFTEDLSNANPLFLSQNMIYRKITIHTLETPPEELLKAIKSTINMVSKKEMNWDTDSDELLFK